MASAASASEKVIVTPEWVRVTDFETRLPEELERVIRRL